MYKSGALVTTICRISPPMASLCSITNPQAARVSGSPSDNANDAAYPQRRLRRLDVPRSEYRRGTRGHTSIPADVRRGCSCGRRIELGHRGATRPCSRLCVAVSLSVIDWDRHGGADRRSFFYLRGFFDAPSGKSRAMDKQSFTRDVRGTVKIADLLMNRELDLGLPSRRPRSTLPLLRAKC